MQHEMDYEFADLVEIEKLQELFDSFYELTGFGIGIIDIKGNIHIANGWQDVCTKFHRTHPETLKKCKESDFYMMHKQIICEPSEYKCKNGMWDVAYPIIIENKPIATIFFGQFFYEDEVPDYTLFEQQAEKYGFDKEEYLKKIGEVPVISRQKVKNLISFYSNMAQMIADLGYQKLISKQSQLHERYLAQNELKKQKDLLDSIIDNLPIGMQIFDANGYSLRINNKQKELLGLPDLQEGIGQFNVLTDPYSMAHGTDKIYRRAYAGEKFSNLELEYNFNIEDNTWNSRRDKRYFNENIFPITDENNKVAYVVSLLTDITNRKSIEKKRLESVERFRSIFENSVAGIAFTDQQGKILLANNAFCELLEYKLEELQNLRFTDFTHPNDLAEESTSVKVGIKAGVNKLRLEKRYLTKSGKIVWVDMSLSIIVDNNNKPLYYVGVVNDISRKKNVEQELIQSEQKYKNLVEHSPDIVYIYSDKSGAIYWSPRVKEVLGFQPEELISDPFMWTNAIHPDDLAKVKEAIHEDHYGKGFNLKYRIITKDGKIVWIHDRFINKQKFGDETIIEGIATDITQNLLAEENLRKSEEKYRSLVAVMNEGVIMQNSKSKIIAFNQTAERILGVPYQKIKTGEIPLSIWKVTDTAGNTVLPQFMPSEITLKTGKAQQNIILKVGKPNGENIWLKVNSEPLFNDSENSPYAVVTTFSDITSQLKYEKQLKELNATKDKLLSVIAHDLKNPFNAILGLSEMLVEKHKTGDFDNTGKYSQMIHEAADQSYKLLINLLDWSRSQNDSIHFHPESLNINEVISHSIKLLASSALHKHIEINVATHPQISVSADYNMLTAILRNLLSNAIKFTPKFGKITITAIDTGDFVQFSVSDTGIGISEQNTEKLFDITTNFSTKGTDLEHGTGLGLLICKNFVEMHDGKIWFQSIPEKRTTFYFTIKKK